MSDENSSGGDSPWPMLAIVVATFALSISFFVISGGFSRQQLWSDTSAAYLAAFDRANPTGPAAGPQPDHQEAARDPEHPLELSGE